MLRAIAQAPYSNNREIAQAAGLADEGQTSKLLARLERQGVIENVGIGAARGEPNAWLLTPSGRRAVELINESFASGAPRQRRARSRGAHEARIAPESFSAHRRALTRDCAVEGQADDGRGCPRGRAR